jgi:hypothetical protein
VVDDRIARDRLHGDRGGPTPATPEDIALQTKLRAWVDERAKHPGTPLPEIIRQRLDLLLKGAPRPSTTGKSYADRIQSLAVEATDESLPGAQSLWLLVKEDRAARPG